MKALWSFEIFRTITQQQSVIFQKPGIFLDRARWISIQKRLETALHKPLDKRKEDINNQPTHFRCCFVLSVPKNSQGAPNCDRTVQLFEALPPRCHRIETHLKQKNIYILYTLFPLKCWSVTNISFLHTVSRTYILYLIPTYCISYLHAVSHTYIMYLVPTYCIPYLHTLSRSYILYLVPTYFISYLHTLSRTYILHLVPTYFISYQHTLSQTYILYLVPTYCISYLHTASRTYILYLIPI